SCQAASNTTKVRSAPRKEATSQALPAEDGSCCQERSDHLRSPKTRSWRSGRFDERSGQGRNQVCPAALVPFLRRHDPDQVQGFDKRRLSALGRTPRNATSLGPGRGARQVKGKTAHAGSPAYSPRKAAASSKSFGMKQVRTLTWWELWGGEHRDAQRSRRLGCLPAMKSPQKVVPDKSIGWCPWRDSNP